MTSVARRTAILLLALICVMSVAPSQSPDGKDVAVYSAESRRSLEFGARLAVVVGIDQYTKGLNALNFAEKDADDVASALTSAGWAVTLMTMSPRTKPHPFFGEDILSQVRRMVEQANVSDTILFYFSGHGFNDAAGENYLCANQTDPRNLAATGLALTEVRRRLEAGKARKRMVIIDACRNVPGKSVAESPGFSPKDLAAAQGTGLLFSTEPEFRSFEPISADMTDDAGRPIKNGIFSHFLLRALAGDAESNGDGALTFREVGYFVGNRMKTLCMRHPQVTQKPFMTWIGGASDDVFIAAVAGPTSREEPPPADPAPPAPAPVGAPVARVVAGDVAINWVHDAGSSGARTRIGNAVAMLRELGFRNVTLEGFRTIREKASRYLEDTMFAEIKNPDNRFIYYSKEAAALVPDLERVFPPKDWQYRIRKSSSRQRDRGGPDFDRTIDVFGTPR